jgi:zinc protease
MKNNSNTLKQVFIVLLTGIFAVSANAQESRLIEKVTNEDNSLNIQYEKYELPNGLTLIVHEDHSDPIVHVEVTYHVGSAREVPGKTGFAHFFEHMMFQGSDNVKDDEHFKIVSESGGTMNGTTNRDKTNYFETMPSNQLETALWLESDRMGFLLDAVDQKKFEVQRSTVKNEKSQNIENQPYAMAIVEVAGQTLYPLGHPYSWPVIGYVDDLDRVGVDDLKEFFLRWYGPNNAYVVVSGDVNTADVVKLTEKYFGSIPKGPEVRKQRPEKVLLASNQYAKYEDNVYFPLTFVVYPTVPQFHRDEAAMDILADLLGGGNNSIMYKSFVKTEDAVQANSSHPTSELAGELQMFVLSYPDFSITMNEMFNNVEKKLNTMLDEFATSGITEEAVERAKTQITSGMIDRLTSVAGKSSMLTRYIMFGRPSFNFADDYGRYQEVSTEDVKRVFERYIYKKNAAYVNVLPRLSQGDDSITSYNPYAAMGTTTAGSEAGALTYNKATDKFDRAVRPTPGPSKAPQIPDFYTKSFANGMKVIGTKTTETPKVILYIQFEGGELLAGDKDKIGIAGLTGAMMNEGTKNFTTEEISAKLEALGSSISIGGRNENFTVIVQSLSENLEATLTLLEEKLMNPGFREDDFKRVSKSYRESVKNRKTSAQELGNAAFNSIVYGDNIRGAYVTEAGVEDLSLSDVEKYYNTALSPSLATLTVVGNLDAKDLFTKIGFLENWAAKDIKIPTISSYPEIEETTIYLVHKPRSPQSIIMAGHLSLSYDATDEYFKSSIANFPLGGAFSSRLNLQLREEKGWTYGIRSFFGGGKQVGPFMVSASVKASATDSSIKEIITILNDYLKDGIKDDELEFTRQARLNRDALEYETPFQKAGFLAEIAEYDLDKSFIQKQQEILRTITKEEINSLTNKNIRPDKMVIVVVGSKYKLKKPLKNLNYKIKEIELD